MNTEALRAPIQVIVPLGQRHLLVAWTGWALACVTLMLLLPGEETIPYHLGWAGFALAFGLGTWSRRQLVTALVWYTVASGFVLERSWLLGHISWHETTEIPLMFLLAVLMVWNVLRRQGALTEVTRLAEREVRASQDRERLTQSTSHELRTPLTIARGYLELMQARAVEPEDRQDLSVVVEELDRLSRVSDRLIRMIGLQVDTASEVVDIDGLLAQSLERWRVVADRVWVLDADAGKVLGSPERLRTGIDTLVENAIRYTCVGDTIRLVGSRRLQHVVLGVLDSGVGLTEDQIAAINAHEPWQPPAAVGSNGAAADLLAGTGLGLSIVREIARVRGGALYATHAPEGGAALTIALPVHLIQPRRSNQNVQQNVWSDEGDGLLGSGYLDLGNTAAPDRVQQQLARRAGDHHVAEIGIGVDLLATMTGSHQHDSRLCPGEVQAAQPGDNSPKC